MMNNMFDPRGKTDVMYCTGTPVALETIIILGIFCDGWEWIITFLRTFERFREVIDFLVKKCDLSFG